MKSKTCSKCVKEKAEDAFYQRSSGNTLHSACKECERLMARDWYKRNKAKAKQNYREWRKANPDKVRENMEKIMC